MVDYLDFKDYSLRTGRSLASVYRDAEKGIIKTTVINGKKHIIIEDIETLNKKTSENYEKVENEKSQFDDKDIPEAEIINEATGVKYEIELIKSTITTIEDFANRIQEAKEETIINLKNENDKKDKTIENLNEIIKTLSHDNKELRIQLAIRETERKLDENRLKEVDNILDDNEKNLSQKLETINQKQHEIDVLNEKIEALNAKIDNLKEENKQIDSLNSHIAELQSLIDSQSTELDTLKTSDKNKDLISRFKKL